MDDVGASSKVGYCLLHHAVIAVNCMCLCKNSTICHKRVSEKVLGFTLSAKQMVVVIWRRLLVQIHMKMGRLHGALKECLR